MSGLEKLSDDDQKELIRIIDTYKEFGGECEKFLDKVPKLLENYQKVLEIDEYKVIKGARLGLVFCGYSRKYNKELVIKIIPKFLDIYQIESNAYKNLSSEYMCKTYLIDDLNNVIVMDKLNHFEPLNYKLNKNEVEKFFDIVYHNSTRYQSNKELNYIDILKKYFVQIGNRDILGWNSLKDNVLNVYEENFRNKELYLIHGDLHANNVLKSNNNYYAIDPLGYVAPREFTFARFIITELLFTQKNEDYFDELLEFISKYYDYEMLLKAVYIDSVMILSALLMQIKDKSAFLPQILSVIEIISKKMLEIKEESYEKDSNSISKARKCVFRGRKLYRITG